MAIPVGTSDQFPQGQCTWWADLRYHALTGHFVPWGGDAHTWLDNAHNSGWSVSNTPPTGIPSIIILQPGVQGAGGLGHVAVVEGVNADGSVTTSNYNWACFLCGPKNVTFHPGNGVSFAWYPGGSSTPTTNSNQANASSAPSQANNASTSVASGWITQIEGEGVKVALFILALTLTGFGFYLLFPNQINGVVRKGLDAAKVAAV